MFLFHFLLKSIFNSLFLSSVLTLTMHVFSDQVRNYGPNLLLTTLSFIQNQMDKEQVLIENPNNPQLKNDFQSLNDKEKVKKIAELGDQLFRKLAAENKEPINEMLNKIKNLEGNPIENFNKKMLEQKRILEEIDQSSQF